MIEELISLAEAAEISGRAPVTLRRAAALGTLEAVRVGNSWATTRDAIGRYIAYVSQREWQAEAVRRMVETQRARRKARKRQRRKLA